MVKIFLGEKDFKNSGRLRLLMWEARLEISSRELKIFRRGYKNFFRGIENFSRGGCRGFFMVVEAFLSMVEIFSNG